MDLGAVCLLVVEVLLTGEDCPLTFPRLASCVCIGTSLVMYKQFTLGKGRQ